MFNIILYQPEIPPNTGNIIRLCANTNSNLHLIKPLGFDLSDKQLKRAGLDYHDLARVTIHADLESCIQGIALPVYALSTKGKIDYHAHQFKPGSFFLFGPETRGLPSEVLARYPETTLRIPHHTHSRSLNLSNAVAIVVFEAWRQNSFALE
jgi:tRNA (cytidine/uridine-2'-O-)-methyltransferase